MWPTYAWFKNVLSRTRSLLSLPLSVAIVTNINVVPIIGSAIGLLETADYWEVL